MPNLIKILFIIIGGKLYLDYILPTNPTTKNPLFKLFYKNKHAFWWRYNSRYNLCFFLGGVHLVFAILSIPLNDFWSISNILVNIYPIIVQLYIGYRIYLIKKTKTHSIC